MYVGMMMPHTGDRWRLDTRGRREYDRIEWTIQKKDIHIGTETVTEGEGDDRNRSFSKLKGSRLLLIVCVLCALHKLHSVRPSDACVFIRDACDVRITNAQ